MSSAVIPTLRYRDAQRMVAWLCDVFGFTQQAMYPGRAGRRGARTS